jgi:hypothetical protein
MEFQTTKGMIKTKTKKKKQKHIKNTIILNNNNKIKLHVCLWIHTTNYITHNNN